MSDKEIDTAGMSIEELLKQESELELDEEPEEQTGDGSGGKDATDPDPGETDDLVEPEEQADDTDIDHDDEPATKDDGEQEDGHLDVSPPEKWIRQRHKAKERAQAEEAKRAASEEADTLKAQLAEAKRTIDLMKSKGLDVPNSPLDMLSDANISNVREEHGDAVADMFLGLRAMIPVQGDSAKQEKQPEQGSGQEGEDRVTALFQNDHIAYWYQEQPELFNKYAVEADKILSGDQAFLNKTYPEQAEAIVEKTKELILAGKKPKEPVKPVKKGKSAPPSNLGGATGTAPATDNKGPADRMIELAEAGRDDEAMKLYEKLPDGDEKLKFENWMEENEE